MHSISNLRRSIRLFRAVAACGVAPAVLSASAPTISVQPTNQTSVVLTNTTTISGGGGRSYVVKGDGTVWGVGAYYLGDGTQTIRSTPVQVLGGLNNVVSVAAGTTHSVALKKDGTVWAWGPNYAAQLGQGYTSGSTPSPLLPVAVPGLSGIVAIAAGYPRAQTPTPRALRSA
ncbi:MAG: hypothetical protein HZA93_12820 [Verrucomicrobia bacterium]|nr:hypothetical protein [Verrucomicrobiota bacterium]